MVEPFSLQIPDSMSNALWLHRIQSSSIFTSESDHCSILLLDALKELPLRAWTLLLRSNSMYSKCLQPHPAKSPHQSCSSCKDQAPPSSSSSTTWLQPDKATMSHIAEVQERKEAEINAQYAHSPQKGVGLNETEAATAIQRTYRGHRARRELAGLSLDPSTRWVEV